MSRESAEWLNTMTLIGYRLRDGAAWHYDPVFQGEESNHYDYAIPPEDVIRRLFNWTAVSQPIYVMGEDGEFMPIPGRQAIVPSDQLDGTVLGIFKDGYVPHQYQEWLLDGPAKLVGGDSGLGIGSAGLLRNRAQAWLSIELPENIDTPEGLAFRPKLMGSTSFDGSLATTYNRHAGIVVCDNTADMARAEGKRSGHEFKARHTKNSGMRIKDAREALAIVETMAEDIAANIATLAATEVSAPQFSKVLDLLVPITKADGTAIEGRGLALATSKRDKLSDLYAHDDRVSPWAGTALGVLQAFNTYEHHYAIRRGEASRIQRNAEYAITGKMASLDSQTLEAIELVLAT